MISKNDLVSVHFITKIIIPMYQNCTELHINLKAGLSAEKNIRKDTIIF